MTETEPLMTLARVLTAAALAAAAVLPATSANATECTPKGCSAACYIDRQAENPLEMFRCYN